MKAASDNRPGDLSWAFMPRGLSRAHAAAYIGVSASTFDLLVKDGLMPAAKRIRGRVVWDRFRLDEYFSALDDGGENPWDAIGAKAA